jgi:hypothetical protein
VKSKHHLNKNQAIGSKLNLGQFNQNDEQSKRPKTEKEINKELRMKYDRGNAYDDDEDDIADRNIKNRKLNKKR